MVLRSLIQHGAPLLVLLYLVINRERVILFPLATATLLLCTHISAILIYFSLIQKQTKQFIYKDALMVLVVYGFQVNIGHINPNMLLGDLIMAPFYLLDVVYNIRLRKNNNTIIYRRRNKGDLTNERFLVRKSFVAQWFVACLTTLVTGVGLLLISTGMYGSSRVTYSLDGMVVLAQYINENRIRVLEQYLVVGMLSILIGML